MFKLIAFTNRHLVRGDFLKQIDNLAASGVDRIVLREKDMNEKAYKKLAEQVLNICEKRNCDCSLHYFMEVALSLKVDAVHLPLFKMTDNIRQAFRTVGVSTHSLTDVKKAEAVQCDYVTFGHVFETDCKKDVPPRGLTLLRSICEESTMPVYAIGGIRLDNIRQVAEAGAKGACIMSGFMVEKDPKKFVEALKEKVLP